MRVLFLIGSDLYSYRFANEICIAFATLKHEAFFLIFRNESRINLEKLADEMKDLIYYERTLLHEFLLPYLEQHQRKAKYLNLAGLSKKYNIQYEYCQNMENEAALKFILDNAMKWNIDVAISIRCIIKHDSAMINYFSRANECYLWNLHPGLLPQYSGIMPVFGAMINHETHFGFTLHRMSEQLDTGSIIDISCKKIDYSKSMVVNTLDLIPAGVELIINSLNVLANGGRLQCLNQDSSTKHFYSFPSADEIKKFSAKNMTLYTREEIIQIMLDDYIRE